MNEHHDIGGEYCWPATFPSSNLPPDSTVVNSTEDGIVCIY